MFERRWYCILSHSHVVHESSSPINRSPWKEKVLPKVIPLVVVVVVLPPARARAEPMMRDREWDCGGLSPKVAKNEESSKNEETPKSSSRFLTFLQLRNALLLAVTVSGRSRARLCNQIKQITRIRSYGLVFSLLNLLSYSHYTLPYTISSVEK